MKFSTFSRLWLWAAAFALPAVLVSGCGGGSSGSNASNSGSDARNAIAFVSTRDGNPEIYLMKSDGTSQTRLTSSAGDDLNPSKSPDGSRIAFESNRDGNSEIYVVNSDGTGLQRLTNDSGAHAPTDTQPVFSPDGTTIAWTSTRQVGTDTDIWLMDATGANQRRLTTSASGEATDNPCFSPDGTQIAYFALGQRMRYRNWTLQFKNRTTGAVTSTSIVTASPRHLRYNLAGTKIAFSDLIPNSNPGRLRIYDVASQTVTPGPVAGSQNDDPTYSPDGRFLAWHASAGTFGGPTPTPQIYRTSGEGTSAVVLTSAGTNFSPDW